MDRGDTLTAARHFTALWGEGTPWDAIPGKAQQSLAGQMYLITATHGALNDDVGGMLVPGVLEALDCPTLLMEGSQSPTIIRDINKGLATRLPNTTHAVIMGASHMAPITHADQVAIEILRFLDQPQDA